MNDKHVRLGPIAVPLVPIKDFSHAQVKTEELWKVIGPTVEQNLSNLPIWELFVLCYAQGLENGYNLAKSECHARNR